MRLFFRPTPPSCPLPSPLSRHPTPSHQFPPPRPSISPTRHVANQIGCGASFDDKFRLRLSFDKCRILTHRSAASVINKRKVLHPGARVNWSQKPMHVPHLISLINEDCSVMFSNRNFLEWQEGERLRLRANKYSLGIAASYVFAERAESLFLQVSSFDKFTFEGIISMRCCFAEKIFYNMTNHFWHKNNYTRYVCKDRCARMVSLRRHYCQTLQKMQTTGWWHNARKTWKLSTVNFINARGNLISIDT